MPKKRPEAVNKVKKLSRREIRNQNTKLLKQLKQKKDGELDQIINNEHEKAFEKINCLDCANCCKTTGPLFTSRDVSRIAKSLRMKPGQFVDEYLREDEDKDYVLRSLPCTFLGDDNYCSIYDVRPKACSEYPHTGGRSLKKTLPLMMTNAAICPAVESMVDELLKNVMTRPKERKMPD